MINCIRKTVIVDIFIIIFFLLMLLEEVTGLFEDELLSAVLIVLFAIHIFINRKSIAASIKFLKDKGTNPKELPAVLINLGLYASLIVYSIMTILSMDFYIIDFDLDFDELYVFSIFILVLLFVLHVLLIMKSIESIIKEKIH